MAGLKRCVKCDEVKLPDQFSKRSAKCKPCAVIHTREWRSANPEKVSEYAIVRREKYDGPKKAQHQLKYRYGLTFDDYNALVDAQNGGCAICGIKFTKTPHVDHCHQSGKIRGLLCDTCNRGIGYFKDDPKALRSAARYLEANS